MKTTNTGICDQNQWLKKKQTREEKRNAKLAKLDPENVKSAKSVMEENIRKRKREEEEGDEESSKIEHAQPEDPIQASKLVGMPVKRQKRDKKKESKLGDVRSKQRESDNGKGNEANPEVKEQLQSQKKQEKKRHGQGKHEAKVLKKAAKKAQEAPAATLEKAPTTGGLSEVDDHAQTGDTDFTDIGGILGKPHNHSPSGSTVTPSPNPQSPIFDDLPVNSGSSTISSIAPPSNAEVSKPAKSADEVSTPKPSQEELRERLAQRIEFLRAARKADGLNGKPARNRQELIEARRQKEEQRKAHKREVRRKEREAEKEKQDQLLARGSPLLFPAASSSKVLRSSPQNNFSFNRIAFADGQNASAELSTILSAPKPKGPQDPLTALQAAQKKQTRIDALDDSTRSEIAEKDLWLNARKHAHGERVRDDTSLLKKTLKRKEQAKKKSEREWGERIEGVEKGKAMRVKRRDENIRKRREEKGGKKSGNKIGKPKPKPKGRPGFEGSLKAKAITSGKRFRK